MNGPSRHPGVASLGAVLALVLAAPSVRADDYDKALKLYKKYEGRPSLQMRTRGRARFARTQDARALEILAKSYSRVKNPRDQERYLLASICADECYEEIHVPIWEAWRSRHSKPQDAWLWYKALEILQDQRGPDGVLEVIRGKYNIFLRAAAIKALATSNEPHILKVYPELLEKLPSKEFERVVLTESLAAGLHRQSIVNLGSDEFRAAALKIIRQLESDKTHPRTKQVIVRYLGAILNSKSLTTDSKYWRAVLLNQEIEKKGKYDEKYGRKRPTFIGIEASGTRICYVIDMSDSMLDPLTGKEKGKMRGPTTGKSTKKKKDDLPDEGKLPWKKIHNRFDVAREYLKLSLRGLDDEKYFAIIFFGSKARPLKSTKGMIKATKGNIAKAIGNLDAIRPGPKGQNRPHGTLMGNTNMHGGLHRAFKIKSKGLVGPGEYVNPATFKTGCDTIFVLSDGHPTWDDWPNQDVKEEQDHAGDPELGGRTADSNDLNFPGPYRNTGYLVDDVSRLNMFRHVEIHCIGMGDAQSNLLGALAGIGRGKVKLLGDDKPTAKKQ